jgi:hypothetical protein
VLKISCLPHRDDSQQVCPSIITEEIGRPRWSRCEPETEIVDEEQGEHEVDRVHGYASTATDGIFIAGLEAGIALVMIAIGYILSIASRDQIERKRLELQGNDQEK